MREITITCQLRWRDVDQLGHLNQSVYHELLEEGRGSLFSSVGDSHWNFPFVLARVELDYKHEVRRQDQHVDVHCWIGKVGTSSIEVFNDVLLPDGTVAASGRSVLVAWDVEHRRSRALTEAERALLEAD